jgi:hypothetical protein
MAHRNDYELYLLSRKYVGLVANTATMLKKFGYSPKTYIIDTKCMKYLERLTHYAEKNQIYEVKNLAALTDEMIFEYKIGIYRNKQMIHRRLRGFKKNGKFLYLVPRNMVPFWLLKEFGGDII